MHVYAMYENGLRAQRGQQLVENLEESASLYGRYAEIASRHPTAWNYGKQPHTANTIGTITEKNRMICHPCEFPEKGYLA